jgi:hypothetical protein
MRGKLEVTSTNTRTRKSISRNGLSSWDECLKIKSRSRSMDEYSRAEDARGIREDGTPETLVIGM